MPKLTNRKDILLLLLFAPGKTGRLNEPIVGRTRLMKMLFLFKKELLPHFQKSAEITEENFYEFFPWNFGPFSSQIYDDLMFFKLTGFIESSNTSQETLPESEEEWDKWLDESGANGVSEFFDAYEEETFTLTPKGVDFTRKIYEPLTDPQQKLLVNFKKRLSSAPLRAILRYVYKTYPEQTKNSTIVEEIGAYQF